jgi:hypothetical protein
MSEQVHGDSVQVLRAAVRLAGSIHLAQGDAYGWPRLPFAALPTHQQDDLIRLARQLLEQLRPKPQAPIAPLPDYEQLALSLARDRADRVLTELTEPWEDR